ncbi:MAGUK p55 subfamily member 7 isoform X2 [Neocloeon triangulifer]|uniref:MAGUK p55 subfamily member 7 isoform X2 n=1 Tax=Neocloeon triangulifer TaxID=2078957 RepID=UPI00286F7B6D|nr:MAGUK p55 subfamily member 7 isoform X2 [Neocloeon triangulifer]
MSSALVMENRNWDPALSSLLVTLEESRDDLPCTEEFAFLSELLQKPELHSLVHIHNKVLASTNSRDGRFIPVVNSSVQAALEALADVLPLIEQPKKSWDSRQNSQELLTLLQTPHVQGLLYAHDCIAQKDYYPILPEVPFDIDEEEETIKIVQLVKSNEPLGATIKTDEETGKIVIARIMHGGAADRSGLIHVGDEVIEVNNMSTEGKTPNDVLQILQNSEGTITFKLVPADAKGNLRESKVRVRAHFDYRAATDPYIPCKEAGLDFDKGDILHIVSQDDAYWWQARKENDRNMRAGLIPSRALQEKRIVHERSSKGIDVANIENDDFDREEIATYEEVAKLYPRPGLHRPVVLVGPPGIGRNELKRRLMALDPEKFKTTIPFTTRPIKHGEINGKEYYFVSREKMEEDIAAGKFLEHGEYKGNLYGTSADSVKSIINAGYVCILNPHYQALKMLRTAEIKPFVVYIKPPSFDVLKETRHEAYARSTFDEANSRGFTDEEFEEIERSAARIEFLYGHWFDEVIENADLSVAFEQMVRAVQTLETEPLWVPASWVQ